jgi:signal peptidase
MKALTRILTSLAPYALLFAIGILMYAAYEPVTVAGGSMQPALRPGDLAVVRRGSEPEEGDIALIRDAAEAQYLHRIEQVRADGALVTRGDANPVADSEPVPPAAVVGTVRAVVPVGSLLHAWREGRLRATLSAQSNSTRR